VRPNEANPPLERSDIDTARLLVVHFWAPWDLYDFEYADRLVQARTSCSAALVMRSLDIDDPEWSEDLRMWSVLNIPAIGLFRNGQHAQTIIGMRPVDQLRELLQECERQVTG